MTPAAQITVFAGMRSVAPPCASTVTLSSSMSTTVWPSSGVTPRCSSARAAFADSDCGKVVRTRSAISTRSTRPARGSITRKSRRSVSRASSPIWPAISTPVGPAPTTTKVSQARRLSSSVSSSAASKALRIWARTASALSNDFTSWANSFQSSCPK